jgi:L-threonylcarbamoyladenylate synthase
LLLPKSALIPDLITSGSDKVAIRIPNHPITLSLLKLLDFPLAAPSANPFGYISPSRAEHVQEQLGKSVPYILDGGASKIGLESTIVDCTDGDIKVLRLGGLSLNDIEECLGMSLHLHLNTANNPSAPGQLDKHYAPKTNFELSEDLEYSLLKNRHLHVCVLGFGEMTIPEDIYCLNLSPTSNLDEAAGNLFHYMRLLDSLHPELIIAKKVPDFDLGKAINDRLKRASVK